MVGLISACLLLLLQTWAVLEQAALRLAFVPLDRGTGVTQHCGFQPGTETEWGRAERFRNTDRMENCSDGALYPLGLEPLERPVGFQLCSHLSDREAVWGRVLPDVVLMFQAVSQPLTASHVPRVHVLLGWGCCGWFGALFGYLCMPMQTVIMLPGCVWYH